MTFDLYNLYDRYNLAHTLPWEAYRLSNGLIVKINPSADSDYPFKVGHTFKFISHSQYIVGQPLYIKGVSGEIREKFPPNVVEIRPNGETVFKMYESKIEEKIPLTRVILPQDPDFDWELLDFTLNGAALFSELLVWIIKLAGGKK